MLTLLLFYPYLSSSDVGPFWAQGLHKRCGPFPGGDSASTDRGWRGKGLDSFVERRGSGKEERAANKESKDIGKCKVSEVEGKGKDGE